MMNDQNFSCQLATKQHWDAILELWQANSEWGAISKETLQKWIEAPYENCDISIAFDEQGTLIGMCFLTYTLIRTPKGLCKSVRFSAPIISNTIKGSNLLDPNHPINRLFDFSFKTAAAHGVDLAYMNPFASWVRVLKISHNYGMPKFWIKSSNLYKISVSEVQLTNQLNYTIVDDFTDEQELAWATFAEGEPNFYAIERSRKWLTYKASDFVKVEINNEQHQLVGLVIYSPAKNLIYDLYVQQNANIGNVLFYLKNQNVIKGDSVKAVGTPNNLNAFSNCEMSMLDFQSSFAVASISAKYSHDELSQANWFLTSLD